MEITKSGGIGGSWIDKKALKSGDLIKLTTEAEWVPSSLNPEEKQLVAKCKVKGMEGEFNLAINSPSKNALIDAFGNESKNWVGKLLTAAVETGIFAGKRGIMLNLVPENYIVSEDAAGFIVIRQKVEPPAVVARQRSAEEVAEGIDIGDIPFDEQAF
jgi:hypothetical protein